LTPQARTASERVIQADIVEALARAGRFAFRVHSGKVRVARGWMQLAPAGTPDLYVLGWGWLEIKTEKGRVRPEQTTMHRHIRAAGERVATVRTVKEALAAVMGGNHV
jgi:hypothetical protein